MRAHSTALGILYSLTVWVASCSGARVVSGQTVCHGGPEKPCYKIAYFSDVSSRVAFWEAKQVCEVDGGSLLSVENVAEQQHIEHLLQNLSRSSSGPGIADGDFWIGLTRVDRESPGEYASYTSCPDLYRWTDGSVSQYRNWYFDEPSCGGEACVVMYHQPTAQVGLGGPYLYQWNDDRCNMKHNFICKEPPGEGARRQTGESRHRYAADLCHHPNHSSAPAHPRGLWDMLLPDAKQEKTADENESGSVNTLDLQDAKVRQRNGGQESSSHGTVLITGRDAIMTAEAQGELQVCADAGPLTRP
ncbi:chondrolectin isoform X2 [Clarias magur]|uniref:Chondrolectin isoform X2 n=1 Tax=Clarias magur TaxID=1594786 RepID=A0A8J4XC86_CLAMG|nr:chondrolectin isoform X2 [Clarias magur]